MVGRSLGGVQVAGRRVGSLAASAAAASAKAAIASPFQAASALSSRAGCGRSPRRARSSSRASASRARTSVADEPNVTARSSSLATRDRIVTPSQFPSSVTP